MEGYECHPYTGAREQRMEDDDGLVQIPHKNPLRKPSRDCATMKDAVHQRAAAPPPEEERRHRRHPRPRRRDPGWKAFGEAARLGLDRRHLRLPRRPARLKGSRTCHLSHFVQGRGERGDL